MKIQDLLVIGSLTWGASFTSASPLDVRSGISDTEALLNRHEARGQLAPRQGTVTTGGTGSGAVCQNPPPAATGLSYTVPPPKSNGGQAWADAYSRAKSIVDQMTLIEKVNFTTGQIGRCAGNTGPVPRLGLESLCLQDGPAGVRPATGKTQFPAGLNAASSWDRSLIYARSNAMGQEFYDLGVNMALAPVTGGPLGRAPREGRNWEGFAADPYATGIAAYEAVRGLLDAGVLSCAKHYIAYEQETYRNLYGVTASYSICNGSQQLPIDSHLDDKTTHELYMWPFAEAVRAGTSSLMCSYNMVNGTHSCANSQSLNGHLKGELNFQGAVISDWGATWGTQAFVEGGEDIDMPGNGYGGALGIFFQGELEGYVQNGTIAESRLDDMVLRLLTPYIHAGQLDKALPSTAINANSLPQFPDIYRLVQKESTVQLVNKIGQDSAVLLRNKGGLPLKNPQRIALLGEDAGPSIWGSDYCGAFGDGCPYMSNNGTLSLAYGSGYSQPQNLIDPLSAIQERALQTRTRVTWALNNTALDDIYQTAAGADVAIVFANAFADEGQDRENLYLSAHGDAVINATASANNNTIVVLHIPGATIFGSWINNPNVTAIIAPMLPGEQTGPSLVSLLWGDVSPSGKLPFTLAKQESDYPPHTIVTDKVNHPIADFTEGVLIDYRWLDAKNIEPLFEFGYGLSYSSFSYSNLQLQSTPAKDKTSIQYTNEKFVGQSEGESIYDDLVTLTVDVKNTGGYTACEVAQLYVGFPATEDQPPRQLRGFDKLKQIAPGKSMTATFPIRRKDVMVWDTVQQKWRLPQGPVTFYAGSSSRKLPLSVRHQF